MRIAFFLAICAVTFGAELRVNVRYPESKVGSSALFLRGSSCGLSWDANRQLSKSGSDNFATTITCADGQALEVKSLLGSSWQQGANVRVLVQRSGAVDIFPHFSSTKGEWKVVASLRSPQLNNSRAVVVYTPVCDVLCPCRFDTKSVRAAFVQ